MSIIDKLEITPGPWLNQDRFNTVYTTSNPKEGTGLTIALFKDSNQCNKSQVKPNADLIAAAPEMLEALIEWCFYGEEHYGPSKRFKHTVYLIEKATGKTWDEIKGLLEEAGDEHG